MMVLQIFSAVLHFGNIHIKEKDGESCEVPVSSVCLKLSVISCSIQYLCIVKVTSKEWT